MKIYFVLAVLMCGCLHSQDSIVKKIFTDKLIYNYGEKVTLTIRATNKRLRNFALVFPDGCQAYPFIDTVDYLTIFSIGCPGVGVVRTMLPNDSIDWIWAYPNSFEPTHYLSVGKHKVYGYFGKNYSNTDTLNIEIRNSNSVKYPKQVEHFTVFNNYPNPFNPASTISYNLLRESRVSIIITNVLGETIETLLDDIQSIGYHKILWKPKNISSGIYYCSVFIDGNRNTKKIVYSK